MFITINKKILLLFIAFTMFLGLITQITNTFAVTSENVTIGDGYQVNFKNEQNLTTESLIEKYKGLLTTFSIFCTLTLMGFLILNITKLAGSAHNPYERKQAISGLIWNFIAITIFGSITFWFMFSYSLFK